MGDDLYFRVLGPVRVERAGEPVPVGSPQRQAVLSLLLLSTDQVITLDRLTAALWGEDPPESSRVQLQSAVSHLRLVLGEGERAKAPIETHSSGYRLRLAPGQVDTELFHQDVAAARRLLAEADFEAAGTLLRTALARWEGPAFEGIDCGAVRAAAAGLADARLGALEDRIETDLALGRHYEAIPELRALIDEHPERERFRGQLMMAYARDGRLVEALDVFRETRARLVADLGVEPSTQLQQLYRAILSGVTVPQQAGSLAARPYVVARQLPPDVPDLIGRRPELTEASRLIAAGRTRLAFTGPGGVGKTALVVGLAHRLRPKYPDGQLFVRLRGATGSPLAARDVLAQFLHALGVPPGGVPADQDERAALYRDLLSTRRVLVVLDDAADDTQVRPLLPAEPRCTVLITSRRRSPGLEGVTTTPLGVLAPDAGLELLGELAGADRIAAEPVAAAAVVRHCGGLPLAIRIAGTRLRSRPNWTMTDLAGRLGVNRDRLDWLRLGDVGVRASLMDTYAALPDTQQRLLRGLGLLRPTEFPGWVAGALLDAEADQALDELTEVHLVEPAGRGVTGPRYRLHDLIHLLAGQLGAQAPDTEGAVGRVLDGWRDLAATADARLPHWHGLDPAPAPAWRAPASAHDAVAADPFAWFGEELETLAAMVGQGADAGATVWPLSQHLATYLDLRGRYAEWTAVTRDGLRAAEAAGDAPGTACMLGMLLDAEGSSGRVGVAVRLAERVAAAYRALGPDHPTVPEEAATPAAPRPELTALTAARSSGDPLAVGLAGFAYVLARRQAGERGGYLPLFTEARDSSRACGARALEIWMLKNIGLLRFKQRRYADAAEVLARCQEILESLGGDVDALDTTAEIVMACVEQGRYAEAESLTTELLDHARLLGHRWDEGRALDAIAALRRARGDVPGATAAYTEALAVWLAVGAPDRVGAALDALAELDA